MKLNVYESTLNYWVLILKLIEFYVLMMKSECQQLICEILRATPEAASADAAAQTAKLAKKAPNKDKRQVTHKH